MASFGILKRSLSTTTTRNAIKNVTVIGGGLMGSGIAQVAAQTGHNVTLVEINSDILNKAESSIANSLGRVAKKLYKDDASAAKKFVEDTQARIKGSTNPSEAVKDSDLIVEAIVEKLEVKHKLFKSLDEIAPSKTIFASNTSSLSIGEIASVTNRKDRFGGLHFGNPVPVVKILEVVRTPETSEETYQALMAWGKAIGKTCITCKDTTGFIINRLLVPYVAEAIRMMERGDASASDIDIAMKLGAGHPLGPIELSDYVGQDTALFVLEGWHKKIPENPLFNVCESQKKLVQEGKLGRKSGEGYYKYNVAAQTGHNVTLVEINADLLKKTESSIANSLSRVAKRLYKDDASTAKKFVEDAQARIKGTTDPSEAVKDSDLIVEAIIEKLEVKHKLFKSLDEIAPSKTIFASNTSSLSIGEIASVTNRKDRFGGLHFFNPVPVMKLLEVVRIPETSEETYQALMAWGKAIGKTCITCKDTPGFVVNRLLVPYVAEAIRMMERGDASARDIDIAMKLGAGYPMGPIELSDYTGHDTSLSVIEGWHKKFPENPLFEICESQKKLVQEGKLGRKSGEGYYKYNV